MTERLPIGPRKPRPTVFADRVQHEDVVPAWYARYNTAHFTFTVRDSEGHAIKFYSKREATMAAQIEWREHMFGDATTNRKVAHG